MPVPSHRFGKVRIADEHGPGASRGTPNCFESQMNRRDPASRLLKSKVSRTRTMATAGWQVAVRQSIGRRPRAGQGAFRCSGGRRGTRPPGSGGGGDLFGGSVTVNGLDAFLWTIMTMAMTVGASRSGGGLDLLDRRWHRVGWAQPGQSLACLPTCPPCPLHVVRLPRQACRDAFGADLSRHRIEQRMMGSPAKVPGQNGQQVKRLEPRVDSTARAVEQS